MMRDNRYTLADIPSYKKIVSADEIGENDRVFYELGYYSSKGDWIRTGTFKEIIDVPNWFETDHRLDDNAYIAHHNFITCKK